MERAIWWGPWRLNREVLSLEVFLPGQETSLYDVDLEQCLSSAEVLDKLSQVAGKVWATVDVMGNLILALDELICPQEMLCGFGISKEVTATEIAKRVNERAAEIEKAYHDQPLQVESLEAFLDHDPDPTWFRGVLR